MRRLVVPAQFAHTTNRMLWQERAPPHKSRSHPQRTGVPVPLTQIEPVDFARSLADSSPSLRHVFISVCSHAARHHVQ